MLVFSVSGWAQVNILTQHNDKARTGSNLNETILNTSNVRPGRFGRLFSRVVDGQIYGQPLYVSNLTMGGGGTHNVVYVTTEHNSVYAFDADDPGQSTPLWKVNVGPSNVTPNPDFGCSPAQCPFGPYHDLFPEVGITGTPVIDLSSQTLYVVAFTKELSPYYPYHQRLHALDITTGKEKFGAPVEISGSVPGTGDGSVDGRISFDPLQHLQRPALLLSSGVVYVAFASHADYNPYHGWVFAYDATTLNQLGIYCTTPNGGAGGIWQSNQGPAADAQGNVYFITGNNRVANPDIDLPNFGESVVKLSLGVDNGLTVVDYFTPCNQCCLDKGDTDLGSGGALLIPGTNLLVGAGKGGIAYLLDQNNLGQYKGGQIGPTCPVADCNSCLDDQIVQRFRATAGSHFSSPIYWNGPDGPLVYFWGNSDKLKAYKMVGGRFRTTPDSVGLVTSVFGGGGLSLSANGSTPGTGIIWSAVSLGNANPIMQMGELHAFDASNVRIDLWGTDINDAFDGLGILAKFNPPTVANGKVYAASASGQLHVYGLLPDSPPPLVRLTAPTTDSVIVGPTDIALTATALSRDGNAGTTVDFYADGALLGTATDGPPYNFVWENAPLGPHTLYTIATGPNGATATSSSVDVNVVASAPPLGSIISIKFVGNGSSMGLDEVAGVGVLARPNWNSAVSEDTTHSRKDGWLNTLIDETGMDTGAKVSWNSNLGFGLPIPDDPGDFRMMRGYLDTSNTTSTNVTVYDLPASFTTNGYDVYVYFDGDNGSESRLANFRIGSTIVTGTDAAGVNFSGTYTKAIAGSAGNYVVIPGLTEARFTVEAIPDTTPIGTRRAPVNSIQIVAHGAMP